MPDTGFGARNVGGGMGACKKIPSWLHSFALFTGQTIVMKRLAQIPALLRRLLQQEDGAITVDWIVLTASIAMLGLAVGFTVSSSVPELASDISTYVEQQTVGG